MRATGNIIRRLWNGGIMNRENISKINYTPLKYGIDKKDDLKFIFLFSGCKVSLKKG
jgi:hypothetical protein